ncbi:hypothetical protein GCM10011320_24560 [Neoroseomonas lacus]|uniref:Uncharacterized protein n=1 Tax=Neoroseomonas lacus TaxID=287609 RepID=A0A917KKF4_9PROT|nr:hypothetical protein GCM10011320_24560 [Neoroseomonas lacus]
MQPCRGKRRLCGIGGNLARCLGEAQNEAIQARPAGMPCGTRLFHAGAGKAAPDETAQR